MSTDPTGLTNLTEQQLRQWLLGRTRTRLELPDYRPAAVLVALTRDTDPKVLLTVRSGTMPTHKGQISFAGGGLKSGETPTLAALREAQEEVGLLAQQLTVLGELDDVFTPVGFHVTPVLALLSAGFDADTLRPSEEVERILLPPLSELRAAEQYHTQRQGPDGKTFEMYRYPWQGHDIWGMTGRVLHELLAAL